MCTQHIINYSTYIESHNRTLVRYGISFLLTRHKLSSLWVLTCRSLVVDTIVVVIIAAVGLRLGFHPLPYPRQCKASTYWITCNTIIILTRECRALWGEPERATVVLLQISLLINLRKHLPWRGGAACAGSLSRSLRLASLRSLCSGVYLASHSLSCSLRLASLCSGVS